MFSHAPRGASTTVRRSAGGVAAAFALLATAATALYAAHPLRQPNLPHGTDTLTHLYTLIPLDHLVGQGVLFSRWAPYRASGFGTPLFNYYAPLAYYAAELFRFCGADAVGALRLALALSLVGGAVGIYLWARDAFGTLAGLVSAAAYVWGPYVLFNTYVRGGLNEQYALLFMPWALWALRRVAVSRRVRYLVLAALAYAGLILAHNLTALLFSPLLWGYALLLTFVPPGGGQPNARRSGLPLLAAGLGLGVSAFFWGPMLLERDAVLLGLLHQGEEFDYMSNFVSPGDLFLPLLNAAPRPALSLAAAGLAVVGLALFAVARDRDRLWEAGFFGLGVLSYSLMALPLSAGLWARLRPLLQFLQFPHRFLGVASLCLAFLAGGGAYALRRALCRRRLARGWAAACAALVLLVAGTLLLPPTRLLAQVRFYPPLPDLDVGLVMRKEREAGNIYSTYVVSFIPRDVQELPPFELLARDGPERLDAGSLPSGATVLSAEYAPLRYDLTFFASQSFAAAFNTFYFPGWKARIDGQPVALAPDVPYGRITVQVPAGQHRLEVWFGTTSLRLAAGGTSLLSLVGLVALTVAFARQRR